MLAPLTVVVVSPGGLREACFSGALHKGLAGTIHF